MADGLTGTAWEWYKETREPLTVAERETYQNRANAQISVSRLIRQDGSLFFMPVLVVNHQRKADDACDAAEDK